MPDALRKSDAEPVIEERQFANVGGVLVPPTAVPEHEPPVVALRHGRRDYIVRRLLLLADLTATLSALAIVVVAWQELSLAAFLTALLPTLSSWALLLRGYGLYGRDAKRVAHTTLDEVPALFHATILATGCTGLWISLATGNYPSLRLVASFAICAFLLIITLRAAVRIVAWRVAGPERVALIGASETASMLVRKLLAHPEYHLDPVGVIASRGQDEDGGAGELPVLGRVEDLLTVLRLHRVERVIVSHGGTSSHDLLALLRRCKAEAVKVTVLPEMFDIMGPSVEVDAVEGVTVLGINPPVLSRSSRLFKRTVDICGAAAVILAAAPACALAAVAIRLESGGPILFRQVRIGRGGRPFRVVKFRTMFTDAEERRAALMEKSADRNWLLVDFDPRVTRVGRWLRKTSIDEIPQLWNVLRGEMSLVGPRPLPVTEDANIRGWGRARLDLTPGITGYWQVLGRTNIPFAEMVKLDYLYVTNWTLWGDVRLILRTLPVVLRRRGVN